MYILRLPRELAAPQLTMDSGIERQGFLLQRIAELLQKIFGGI